MRSPIEEIEEATDIHQRGDETNREYIQRVLESSDADLNDNERENLVSFIEKQAFAPDGLDESEKEALSELIERIRDAPILNSGNNSSASVDDTSPSESNESISNTAAQDSITTPNESKNSRNKSEPSFSNSKTYQKDPNPQEYLTLSSVPRARPFLDKFSNINNSLYIEEWAYITGILFAWAYIYLNKLGDFQLRIYDEAVYAHAAQRTVNGGPWIIPHIYFNNWAEPYHTIVGNQPFFLKPPLGIWLEAISMSVFGTTKFAARLPSAVLMLLTTVLLYYFAREIYNRHTAGFAAIIFMTIPQLYALHHGGRAGALEIPLLFFGTLYVCSVWLTIDQENPRWLIPMGLGAGLAVLTKGFGAGIFVLVVLPLVLLYWRSFWNIEMVKAVGIVAFMIFPWAAFAYFSYGNYFVQVMFVDQVVNRITGSDFVQQSGTFSFMKYPYFRKFPTLSDPWAHYLLPAIAVAGVRSYRSQDRKLIRDSLFLIWWIVVVFAFFAYTGNHSWYIIPLYIPMSILIGYLANEARKRNASAIGGIIIGSISLILLSGRLEGLPTIFSRHNTLGEGGILFFLIFVAILIAILANNHITNILNKALHRDDYRISRVVLPGLLIISLIMASAAPVTYDYPYTQEQERLGNIADAEVPEGEQVYTYRIGGTPIYTFLFFYGGEIESLDGGNIDSDVNYILTRPNRLQLIDQKYVILGNVSDQRYSRYGNLTLIELNHSD